MDCNNRDREALLPTVAVTSDIKMTTTSAEPLLETDRINTGSTTLFGTVYLIINTVLGTGLLTLPFGLHATGIGCGVVMMTMVAMLTSYSLRVIQRICDTTNLFTFKVCDLSYKLAVILGVDTARLWYSILYRRADHRTTVTIRYLHRLCHILR